MAEAGDGLEALQKAQQFGPDLILLDIGLPSLNGIEAARRLRDSCAKSKILFLSDNRSADIVEEALRAGACGYVVKSDAWRELLIAVEAVLAGSQFVSIGVPEGISARDDQTSDHAVGKKIVTPLLQRQVETARRHEVVLYSDDRRLLDTLTQFIGNSLVVGNAAIVIGTEFHRDSLLNKLQACGLDMAEAVEQGRYVGVDAADTISKFVVNEELDSTGLMEAFGNLILKAAKAAKTKTRRVAIFGEGSHVLWSQGKIQAALQDEKLCNQLTKIYDVDILCAYCRGRVESRMDNDAFQRICAEHSAVHSQ